MWILHTRYGYECSRSATNQNPSDQEIREWLEGNICRCTGYQNIVAAVKEAATKCNLTKGE